MALNALRLRTRCAQADGEIVGEVIAANGHRAGVAHDTTPVDDKLGGATADVQQAAAEVALVLREARFGGGERLEPGIANQHSGTIFRGDEILRRCNRGSDEMNVRFQALADHADMVANSLLGVDEKFVGQDVQDFAVGRQGDAASRVNGSAHVFALDVARAMADADSATAAYAAYVNCPHAHHSSVPWDVGDAFVFFHGADSGT